MFLAFIDVVLFIILFPCCAFLFEVVGLRPSLWRQRARVYCRGRDGYGALSLDDEDDSYGDGGAGAGLRMRDLQRGSGSSDSDSDDEGSDGDEEAGERGGLLGGPVRSPKDEKEAARQREQALKQKQQQVEKRRKRQERRQRSNEIWMKAMVDYTAQTKEKHKAGLDLMDAYHPGAKARAQREVSGSDEEEGEGEESGLEPEPEPEPGSVAFVLAEHRLERWAAKLERIGVEDVEDLHLVELDDLKSLGMNKLERVRYTRCVEQLAAGSDSRSVDSEEAGGESSGGGGGSPSTEKRVTFDADNRPIGSSASGKQWDQSQEVGGGALKLGAHGWWRIDDNDDEKFARVDHAGVNGKTHLFCDNILYTTKTDHFTKTGSGQT